MIKKLFYVLIIFIVMVLGLTFVQEAQQPVVIDYHADQAWGFRWEGNLAFLIMGVFIAGLLVGYLFSVVSNLRLRGKLMSSKRKLKKSEAATVAATEALESQENQNPSSRELA